MATEKEANRAREEHSKLLQSLGVHAISVDEVGGKGTKNFVVVAYLEKNTAKLPSHLEVISGKKKVKVPVVAQLSEKFKPE